MKKMLIYKKNYMAKWSQRINKKMVDLNNFVISKLKKVQMFVDMVHQQKQRLLLNYPNYQIQK